jgi:hypothetical protein
MDKEQCVRGLQHMAAYKSLGLTYQCVAGETKDPSPHVIVEQHQLEVLKTAIFLITGETFEEPKL